MIPGVEESLINSLDVYRSQLNERGFRILHKHPSISDITIETLREENVLYIGEFFQDDSSYNLQNFLTETLNLSIHQESYENISLAQMNQRIESGNILSGEGLDLFESYLQGDSTVMFVGFETPDYVVKAKNLVTSALRNYRTLGLLRETMVEEKAVWFVIFIFILFIAIVSVLLARLVSSGVSGPIRKLTEGMRRIGAGDLDYKVEAKAKDEVAYLIESFNRMVKELKVSRENLQRAERAAAWRDIARQVSHEIKNPLTPIEFSIYRLESSLPVPWENSDLSESLRIIKEEIAAIRRIADTFSKFARMPHAEFKTTSISDVVAASVDLFRNEKSGINIQYKATSGLPHIPLDEQQIRSVLHNLLKNAIEASEPANQVYVQIKMDAVGPHGIRIDVRDEGCGMDEKTIERIFDPYFTTKEGGSGIGLFLAQRIISDHNGQIRVASEPGKGTTFSIYL